MEQKYEIIDSKYDESSNSYSITLNILNKNTEYPKQNMFTYKDNEGNTLLEWLLIFFNFQAKDGNIYNFDLMKKRECIDIIHYIQSVQIQAYLYIIFTLLFLGAFIRIQYA